MKAQITMFMLLGVILLVGALTVLAYTLLVVVGIVADPFVAADVTSYFNSCFDQALQCSLYGRGLTFQVKDLSALHDDALQLARDSFPVCLRNISNVFRGRSIQLGESDQKLSLFFADRETRMTLDNPATVKIGKATKKISGLVTSKPVAFARIADIAKDIYPVADKLDAFDQVISDLQPRYRTHFFETDGKDIVVLRDVESNISYRNPYTVVFSE